VAKNVQTNTVYFSRTYYASDKARDRFAITRCSWLSGNPPDVQALQVKIRHGKHLYECELEIMHDGTGLVKLATHDQGLAAGQFAVFYDGEYCLGSGMIVEQ
jgi:tRNA-specific 2-thiouridylase